MVFSFYKSDLSPKCHHCAEIKIISFLSVVIIFHQKFARRMNQQVVWLHKSQRRHLCDVMHFELFIFISFVLNHFLSFNIPWWICSWTCFSREMNVRKKLNDHTCREGGNSSLNWLPTIRHIKNRLCFKWFPLFCFDINRDGRDMHTKSILIVPNHPKKNIQSSIEYLYKITLIGYDGEGVVRYTYLWVGTEIPSTFELMIYLWLSDDYMLFFFDDDLAESDTASHC